MGALAIFALASAAISQSTPLPPAQLEIALSVAASGLPQCTSYHRDGSQGPCLPSFVLKRGREINAWSANGQITITTAATTRLTREEFTLLTAHEVAHWYLGHTKSTREAELAADELGARLACAAGFDPAAGAGLFRHLWSDGAHASAAERVGIVVGVGCQLKA